MCIYYQFPSSDIRPLAFSKNVYSYTCDISNHVFITAPDMLLKAKEILNLNN